MANTNTQAVYPYKHYYSTPERIAQRFAKGETVEGWTATEKDGAVYTQATLQKLFQTAAGAKVPESAFARIKTQSYLKYNYGAKVYANVIVPVLEETGYDSQASVDALKAVGFNAWEFMFINRGDLTALIEKGIDPNQFKEQKKVWTASKAKTKRTDVDELFSDDETEEDI